MKRTTNNNTNVPNSQEPKRAALYVRVSSDEQARGESIGDQLQALRKWAADNGHIAPLEYIDEGFSARKSYKTRPAMQRLVADIEADKISVVAFVRIDRWFRSLRDYYAVQTILDAHGVDWDAITQRFDTLTSSGRLALNTHLSVSEFEADQTSDRIKFTISQKRERGEVVCGSVPLGYRIENKKPVKDEKTAPVVEAFFNEYTATGRFRASIDAAAAAGMQITVSRAAGMLKRAASYAGTVQGIPTYAYITPEQAEKILESRHNRPRSSGIVHLFAGYIYCSECGHRMSAHPCVRTSRVTGEKTRFTSYFCHRQVDRKCHNKVNIMQKTIEAELLARLEPELDAYILQAETAAAGKKPATDPRAKIKALEDKRARLVDLYIDGAITKQAFEKRRATIDDEIARLSVAPVPEKRRKPAELRALVPADWKEIYEKLTPENRRAYWFQLLDRIEINAQREISFFFAP